MVGAGNTLPWRHDERYSLSNHQHHDCLLNRLFRRRSKKTSKLRVTGLCEGNSPLTDEFPVQRASNAEKCFHLMTSSWIMWTNQTKHDSIPKLHQSALLDLGITSINKGGVRIFDLVMTMKCNLDVTSGFQAIFGIIIETFKSIAVFSYMVKR